ncbi:uncharacterized protein [Henckelia pumila]
MFRRSDSTFGLVDSKEDVFGWSSSEYDRGKSGEALQSDFGFPCHEMSMQSNVSKNYGSSKSYTELSDAPIWIKDGSCSLEESDSYTSFVDGLGIGDGVIPEEQMNQCKNQFKQLKHMEKRRKEHNLGNGSNSYLGNLPYEINQISTVNTSLQGYPSASMSQQLHAAGPDSFFYLQNNGSQPYSDNSQLSERASVTFADSTTLTPWVSSPPSNQMQFMGNSHAQSLLTAISATDNGVDIHAFQSNLSSQSASLIEQAFVRDPGLVGKRVKLCGDKFEDPTDAGGASLAIPVEPGSSNVQESSMISMGMDDISLAAASFCQLQLVMEWLDLRTKLCIRDGLYRLARGAEQRINHANLHGISGGGSFMAEETNNCNSLINMETGTNPIDRSIAQLLFHRPSIHW